MIKHSMVAYRCDTSALRSRFSPVRVELEPGFVDKERLRRLRRRERLLLVQSH